MTQRWEQNMSTFNAPEKRRLKSVNQTVAAVGKFLINPVFMGEVDPAFIQSAEHRPNLPTPPEAEEESVPLISLSSPTDRLVSEIREACRTWGFFQLVDHDVPAELVERIRMAAKEFFEEAGDEKRKVKRDEVNAMGYHDAEHTKNVRDWKEVFDFLLHSPALLPASPLPHDHQLRILNNQWPSFPPYFREVCEEYGREVEKVAYRVLEVISVSLGLPGRRLDGFFKEQSSMVRLNYYPPCSHPDLVLGVGRHKDAGALTILAQDDVGGLQVKRKSDGQWIPVHPVANALIINVGDAVQVWSNDGYESVEHRVVVNREKERVSVPFFFFPGHWVMVKPLEELVKEGEVGKYKAYNWGKFFAARNRSDYKKLEEDNIQVSEFRNQ